MVRKRVPRKKRPKEKGIPKGYDSKWEYDLHLEELNTWQHHPAEKINYTTPHTYQPDFVKNIGKKEIIVEAKGRFWDYAEYSKYIHIRENGLNKKQELVFLFSNPSAPMPASKRRRDGTKRSHAEWAESNGFKWFSKDTFPKRWRK